MNANHTLHSLRSLLATAAVFFCATAPLTAANLDINFNPADFPDKNVQAINVIDNIYWPLLAGTNAVYFAETADGCEVNLIAVTSAVKDDFQSPYDTIEALEVADFAWFSEACDGEYVLHEKTTDWHAQDNVGNIWYLGEATEAYDDEANCISGEGAWEAGVDSAVAGIVMLAKPRKGLAYRQEFLEGEAEDQGKVLRLNANVALASPFGPFAGCLKIKESTTLDPGSVEHKFYCPNSGPGLVLINELHGRTVRVEYLGDSLPAGTFPHDLPAAPACPE